MLQLLHPRERILHPLNRRLDELQIWSGCSGEQKNLLPLLGFGPQVIKPTAQSLWWLQYFGSISVTLSPQVHTVGKIKTCKKCWRSTNRYPPPSRFKYILCIYTLSSCFSYVYKEMCVYDLSLCLCSFVFLLHCLFVITVFIRTMH